MVTTVVGGGGRMQPDAARALWPCLLQLPQFPPPYSHACGVLCLCWLCFLLQSVNPNTLAAALGGADFRVAADTAASLRHGMPPPSKGTITSYPLEAIVVLVRIVAVVLCWISRCAAVAALLIALRRVIGCGIDMCFRCKHTSTHPPPPQTQAPL